MSVGFSGGKGMAAALKRIASNINKGKEVSVGFLEGSTYPDGTGVPMVAAVHNYGAPEAGIPPRPFFSDMVAEKSPEWGDSLGDLVKSSDYDAQKALQLMGEGIKKQLQGAIKDITTPELAPSTVARKGFDKVLVDTGHMQNSVGYEVKS